MLKLYGSPQCSTQIRIDEDTKKKAQDLFESLGMTTSTAVTLFLKQSIREQALPFTPSLNTEQQNVDQFKQELFDKMFMANKEIFEGLVDR